MNEVNPNIGIVSSIVGVRDAQPNLVNG
jgi:hypothetical protein